MLSCEHHSQRHANIMQVAKIALRLGADPDVCSQGVDPERRLDDGAQQPLSQPLEADTQVCLFMPTVDSSIAPTGVTYVWLTMSAL